MIAQQILETKLINQYNRLYADFKLNNSLKLNLSNDIDGLIQDVKADSANSTYKKEIITNYGTLKTGDYITFNDTNYIIESQIDTEIACDKAFLLECPYSIKIFDWDYNNILEYPISLKNNNARLGVAESAITITANSSFDIILKYDLHTRSFIRNTVINGIEHAKIMRVLIDNMAFSVVGVNHLISEGLLVISIENTNINPTDNLDLGVADYYTYFRETDQQLVDAEMFKYETSALITKDVLAGADVTSTVFKLKDGQTANPDVTVNISAVGINGLLTLNAGVVTLTNQIPFETMYNTTTVSITFVKNAVAKTLNVNVTIEKQDEIEAPPDLVISGDPEVCIGETNTFSINTSNPVNWSVTNLSGGITLHTSGTSNTCSVELEYATKHIGKTEILTATVNGFEYTLTLYLASLI